MNKNKISEKLNQNIETAISTTKNLNADKFFKQFNEKWSIAENLVHLAKSAKGFNQALAMPKEAIVNFGKPEVAARNYDEIVAYYLKVLANRPITTSPFSGQLADSPNGGTRNQQDSQEVLDRFQEQHSALLSHLNDWTEEDLDIYVVPHPILGKLSMREMYYFMTYHIGHHQVAIDRILSQ